MVPLDQYLIYIVLPRNPVGWPLTGDGLDPQGGSLSHTKTPDPSPRRGKSLTYHGLMVGRLLFTSSLDDGGGSLLTLNLFPRWVRLPMGT